MDDFWLKQSSQKPLFEDILWSKPENPHQRPKVLIVGGSLHGFISSTKLYQQIKSKTAYQTKVVMPKSVEGLIGHNFEDAVFVEATQSGEISSTAKNNILQMIEWAEVVIISDDIGNNSQTELLLQDIVSYADKPIFVLGHSIELLSKISSTLSEKGNLVLVGNISQLSQFSAHTAVALLNSDGLLQLVDKLKQQSAQRSYSLVTFHQDNLVISKEKVVTTKAEGYPDIMIDFIATMVQFCKNFERKEIETLATTSYLISSNKAL